jgi:uncharacterized protein YegJ (DUF2314 family)
VVGVIDEDPAILVNLTLELSVDADDDDGNDWNEAMDEMNTQSL